MDLDLSSTNELKSVHFKNTRHHEETVLIFSLVIIARFFIFWRSELYA